MGSAYELHGLRVLECAVDGEPSRTAEDATDIIGETWTHEARLIVLRADWLGWCRLDRGRGAGAS